MACSQNARTATATKAPKSRNKVSRERQAGNFTASTGLAEKASPRAAAFRVGARII
jgi:hypothetical protein